MSTTAISSVSSLNKASSWLVPAHGTRKAILKLAEEKPLIAGGTALTAATLIISLISKSRLAASLFGIPAISLFAYQIFSGTNTKQDDLKAQDTQIESSSK